MDLEEILTKYNGIVEWTRKIDSVTEKASIWEKAFVDGLNLLYPLSGKTITIPTNRAATSISVDSIIISHKLWVDEYGYRREVHYGNVDVLYKYKDEIIKSVKNEKQDALRDLIVLGKKLNMKGGYQKIEKEVDIDIFVLREDLQSHITQRQEHIKKITVTFSESGYVSCESVGAKSNKNNWTLSTHRRNIDEIFKTAQIYDVLEEIFRDYYEEVKGYVEPNMEIAQQMEDAVIQFKVAKKLSQ